MDTMQHQPAADKGDLILRTERMLAALNRIALAIITTKYQEAYSFTPLTQDAKRERAPMKR